MIKILALLLAATMSFFSGAGVIQITERQEEEKPKYSIEYLTADKTSSKTREANESVSEQSEAIALDCAFDAYVVDGVSLNNLNEVSLSNYLAEGGVVIVEDTAVKTAALLAKLGAEPSDYTPANKDRFGFYVRNVGDKQKITDAYLGYIALENDVGGACNTDDIPRDDVVIRIMDSVQSEREAVAPKTNAPALKVNTWILDINFRNFLYVKGSNEFCISYWTTIQVWFVAKIMPYSDGGLSGVYDVLSTFEFRVEPKYYIADYSLRVYSPQDIHAITPLAADKNKLDLGSALGVGSDFVDGSWDNSLKRDVYLWNLKNISNNFGNEHYKYWDISHHKSVGMQYNPAVIIRQMIGETYTAEDFARVEMLRIYQSTWPFDIPLKMFDEFRKELRVKWNIDGKISYEVVSG